MNTILDSLFLRRPILNYLSPGICEATFSGTGSPIIILPDFNHHRGPTGLAFSSDGTSLRLRWNAYPGAVCYNVYTAVLNADVLVEPCSGLVSESDSLQYRILFECLDVPFFILPTFGCYRVSAITLDGESDLSDPICSCSFNPFASCPDGFYWDQYYQRCLCVPFPCAPGDTWDPLQCTCVLCGTQPCPPGFHRNPGNTCECLPCTTPPCPVGTVAAADSSCGCVPTPPPNPGGGPLPPITVCNDEQTATCDPPNEDRHITVDANTFCQPVYNPTVARVATVKDALNAEALAAAEDELECFTCPTWDDVVWGIPNTSGSFGGGTNTFSGTGGAFESKSLVVDGNGLQHARVETTGTLTFFDVGRCSCNLHVDMTKTGFDPHLTGLTTGFVQIIAQNPDSPDIPLLDTGTFETTNNLHEVFDFPFNTNILGGAESTWTILVRIRTESLTPGHTSPGGYSIDLNCLLTNLS